MFTILFVIYIIILRYISLSIKDHLSKWIALLFSGYWFFSLLLSTFNPYGLYEVSHEAYWLLILNVVSFIFGFSVIRISKNEVSNLNIQRDGRTVISKINKIIDSKLFLTFVILCTAICLILLKQYFTAIFLNVDTRGDAMELIAEGNEGNIILQIYFLICPPLFYSLSAISAYMIICYRHWRKLLIFLIYIFSYSLIGGGRTAFLVFFIALLFSLFLCRDIFHRKYKIVLSKSTYIFIILLGIVSYVTMSFLTVFVFEGDFILNMDSFLYGSGKINETFITYSLLPFRLFDYGLSNNYLDIIGYQYGLSTLDGLNRYAYIILNKIGITIHVVANDTTSFFQEEWIHVGKDTAANYAYTNAMYHYLDFGVLGIFLFPFLFGLFFRTLIKRLYISFSVPLYCLLFYLFYILIHTVFTWHIQKVYALGFILLMTYYSFRKHRFVIGRSTQISKNN